MSRNRNNAISLVFDAIKLHLLEDETFIQDPDFDKGRYVYGDNSDIDWLTYFSFLNVIHITTSNKFAIAEYNDRKFVVITGYDSLDPPQELDYVEMNAGLFVAVVSEIDVPIRSSVNSLQIIQNVLSIHTDISGYSGHRFEDLKRFFNDIAVFEIPDYFTYDDIYQLACLFVCVNNKKMTILNFSDDVISSFKSLAYTSSNSLRFDNVLQAISASQYKFCFLDLYRCIEMLYQIIYIENVYDSLSIRSTKLEVLSVIDDKLSWKPNERSSLNKVFSETPVTHKQDIINAVRRTSPNQTSSEKCSNWLYDLRCSIVHLKTVHVDIRPTDSNWNDIIYGLNVLLKYWYSRYNRF